MEVRVVSSNGCLSWKSAPLFVATALAGEYVAFEEVDEGLWTLWFATVPSGAVRRTSSLPSSNCFAGRDGALRQLRWLRAPNKERRTAMSKTFDQLADTCTLTPLTSTLDL